jgi:hypothetical protein
LKPVPNVIVYDVVPLVTIVTEHNVPAAGTVDVSVLFAVTVNCVLMFVANACVVVSLESATYPSG